jgi:hypothetical protein
MDESEAEKIYPFAAVCPLCGGHVDGLVDPAFCLGGGGPYAEKVSGLIQHRCDKCGKVIGLRLRLGTDGVEVLESDAYIRMLEVDYLAALQKPDKRE